MANCCFINPSWKQRQKTKVSVKRELSDPATWPSSPPFMLSTTAFSMIQCMFTSASSMATTIRPNVLNQDRRYRQKGKINGPQIRNSIDANFVTLSWRGLTVINVVKTNVINNIVDGRE